MNNHTETESLEKGFSITMYESGVSIDAYLDKIENYTEFVSSLDDAVVRLKNLLGADGASIEKSASLTFTGEGFSIRVFAREIEDLPTSLDQLDEMVAKLKKLVLMDKENSESELEKAVWTTKFINNLPDSSFAYIESGGKKDSEGKTKPRTLRHLPYKDASGKVDLPHLRNAIARAPRVKGISAEKAKAIQDKLRKILARMSKSWEARIVKADDERHIVYGVVMEPDVYDTQSDITDEIEIEKAAHEFMISSRMMDKQHKDVLSADVAVPVESYIALADFDLGGETIIKGSWVMATYIPDDDIWQSVKKGEINAYSIRGFGVRTPVDDE